MIQYLGSSQNKLAYIQYGFTVQIISILLSFPEKHVKVLHPPRNFVSGHKTSDGNVMIQWEKNQYFSAFASECKFLRERNTMNANVYKANTKH